MRSRDPTEGAPAGDLAAGWARAPATDANSAPGSSPRVDRLAAALLAAALLLGIATRGANFFSPFGWNVEGWLGAMRANAARNLEREGIIRLRGLPYLTAGPIAPGDLLTQVHHPPLLHIVNALVFRALGAHDWAARIFPSLAFLGSIVLVLAIGRRLVGARDAAVGALAFYEACAPGALSEVVRQAVHRMSAAAADAGAGLDGARIRPALTPCSGPCYALR